MAKRRTSEIVFHVEEDPADGGYVAHALGQGITTQAESVAELKRMIRDAVRCHFDKTEDRPTVIRLIFTREEVMASS
jgi:predicted RNase H-like HicB family nuclease